MDSRQTDPRAAGLIAARHKTAREKKTYPCFSRELMRSWSFYLNFFIIPLSRCHTHDHRCLLAGPCLHTYHIGGHVSFMANGLRCIYMHTVKSLPLPKCCTYSAFLCVGTNRGTPHSQAPPARRGGTYVVHTLRYLRT